MTNKTTYYTVKLGDNLWDISKKTGIPYETLTGMKGLRNLDEINPGDQIVWQDGVATYENHLYGPLSQEERPQATASDKPTTEQTAPSEKPAPAAPPADKKEEGRSATKSCEVCDNKDIQCLCEVTLTVSKSKDGSSQEYYWKSRKEGRKAIPKVIIASGFPSTKTLGVPGKGEETPVEYKLTGCCEYGSEDECVQSEILTLSAPKGKYEEDKKPGGKEGDIDLTYDKKLELYADISSKRINIHPKPQHKSMIESGFVKALKFLLLNELADFPVNYRKFSVAECDTKKNIDKEKVVTHFVSVPAYKVVFDIGIAFDGEGIEPDVYDQFKDEKLSPSIAQYGRAKGTVKVDVYYNNEKVEIEVPALSLTSIPVMNKLTAFLNMMKNERTGGNRVSSMGKSQFPISFSFIPTEIHIQAEAQFTASGDTAVERSGTVNFDPILGGVLRINIFTFITKVTAAVGAVVDKIIDDKFSEITKVASTNTSARSSIIKGKKLWFLGGAKAAAFFYLETTLVFKGRVKLVPHNLLKPRGIPFAEPTLGMDLNVGLYAGLYIEAKLFGFSGSLNAGMVVETSFSAEWKLDDGTFKVWHNGIWVRAFIEVEAGFSDDESGKDYGDTGDSTIAAKKEWNIQLMNGGSDKNPMLVLPENQETTSNTIEGIGDGVEVNIRDEWVDDNPPKKISPEKDPSDYRNQNWGRGGIGGGW